MNKLPWVLVVLLALVLGWSLYGAERYLVVASSLPWVYRVDKRTGETWGFSNHGAFRVNFAEKKLPDTASSSSVGRDMSSELGLVPTDKPPEFGAMPPPPGSELIQPTLRP